MKTNPINKTSDQVESMEGLPIRYDVYCPAKATPAKLPTILFLHGFKGFKDWGTHPYVCQRLSAAGFAVVAMNFSLNGVGENPMQFDRLDLFARETFSQDLHDIAAVLQGIHQQEILGADQQPLNANTVGVLGHSRGGQMAVVAAAEFSEIKCLVTWSAVADYNARWSQKQIHDWETKGVTEVENGRTGQIMPMKKVVYDDAVTNASRVIALNRVNELKIPSLFVHSKNDEAVPSTNAEQLYKKCSSDEKDLFFLENTGHTFGGTHPFGGGEFPGPLQQAFEKTEHWFTDHLK